MGKEMGRRFEPLTSLLERLGNVSFEGSVNNNLHCEWL